MRGDKTLMVLQAIGEGALHFSDLMLATLLTSKGNQGKIEYRARLIEKERENIFFEKQQKQRFYNLLYKLRKDNLIEINPLERTFTLTNFGIEKLLKLKKVFLKRKDYISEKDESTNIIAFDIPERYKTHRDWLRHVIKQLGFRMLQKSVWIGKIKIPREVMEELERLKLLDYVQILAITKGGTIKEMKQ